MFYSTLFLEMIMSFAYVNCKTNTIQGQKDDENDSGIQSTKLMNTV